MPARPATAGARRRRIIAFGLAGAVALLIAGCQNPGEHDQGPGGSPASGGSEVADVTPASLVPAVTPGTAPASPSASASVAAPLRTPPPPEPEDTSPVVACGDPLVPLDKAHRLAQGCVPAGLRALPGSAVANGSQRLTGEAGDALVEMFASAASEGLQLLVSSAYRSYSDQVATYQYWVNTVGPEEAARTSARPGHSEHQLGTTVDLTSASVGYALVEAFGETAEGRWLAERCWTFGFFISYPAGKEAVTGYAYEPWHFRFVGNTVASSVRATGLTLHEYLLR